MAKLPDQIGPYKIRGELGHGSSATVYLAQKDGSDEVALKVPHLHIARQPGLIERFEREAQTIAQLSHPHIIRIFDIGKDDEIFFIAMECIPSGTLRKKLKGPLLRKEIIHIIRCIGAALTYAHHEYGIIHRDVKPENILLDANQEELRPVLTDFGLAKPLPAVDNQSTITIGTPYYMAPEQWRMEAPTPATDLYALAIVLFEMLVGRPPFGGISPLELMQKHLNETLPLLSVVAPDVDPIFDGLLARATAKRPADRFRTVAEFIEAIEIANTHAERADQRRHEQQEEATTAFEVVQRYRQRSDATPEQALNMIDELVLKVAPWYVKALRLKGEIYLERKEFGKALEFYKQAYDQVRHPSSEAGIDYLETLQKAAEAYWEGQDYHGAVQYYRRIVEILGENDYEDAHIQEIRGQVWPRLEEFHRSEGTKAYAQGNPLDLDEAIKILDDHIHWLERLRVNSIDELKYCRKSLQIKKYQDEIKANEEAIAAIRSRDSDARFKLENIIQYCLSIDENYQNLIKLDQDNYYAWRDSWRKKLEEQAEIRYQLATQAEEEFDNQTALREYKAIRDIQEIKDYPELSKNLNLNLVAKIAQLEKWADLDGKYNEIRRLIDDERDYPKAFERLYGEFIHEGNYDHRDVAKLFWILVQARKNNWQLTTVEIGAGIKAVHQRLVRAEQARLWRLRNMLEPWSKILILIEDEKAALLSCEEDINRIEKILGNSESGEAKKHQDRLLDLRNQIQRQHNLLNQIGIPEIAYQIETWLQKINDAEAYLQQDEGIQEFINKYDEEMAVIEEDQILEILQIVPVNILQLRRNMDKIKAQIKRQYIDNLTQDIDQIDRQRKLFVVSLIPALLIGGVIGVLIAIVASENQNLLWASIIVGCVTIIFWLRWFYSQSRS